MNILEYDMNVVFIYPYEQAIYNHNYEFHRIHEHPIQFNFAIAILSAVLKKYGYKVKILPLISEKDQSNVYHEKLDWADIFCFSLSEAEMDWTIKLSKNLKKRYPEIFQVAGGIGPTLNPEYLLCSSKIDSVCVGEGEYALPTLLDRLQNQTSLLGIENLYFQDSAKNIYKSKIGQIVEDLDTLPIYDYEVFDEFPLKHLQSNLPRLYYLATRNCFFNCSFCANHRKQKAMGVSSKKKYVRRYSPERVISDLQYLVKRYPQAKVVHFNDEIIHADKKWFEKFSDQYKKNINLPWRSYASLALLDECTIKMMKDSNCYRVNVGIEAGSERIRNEVYNRPKCSNDNIIKKMKLLKHNGIGIHASNLFGAPTETLEEMFETLMLNARGGSDILSGGVVVPYRNTKLYEISKKMNRLDEVAYNNAGVSIIPENDIKKEQIMFINQYIVELVKILQYALTLSEESCKKIIEFVKWIIRNPEIDFKILLDFYPLFFRDISNDLAYEKMETRFGRQRTVR